MATAKKKTLRSGVPLDQIVATYAPIGVAQKRLRDRRRVSLAGASLLVVAAGVLIARSDIALIERLADIIPSGDNAMSRAEIARLAEERALFAEKLAELESQISVVQLQREQLEQRSAAFDEQNRSLAMLLDQTDDERNKLEQRQQQGSLLDKEIEAISAQRKALAQRWEQFEAQGELLAMEIVAVNAQRKELEAQRRQIERQRQELAEMLEQADALHRRNIRATGFEQDQENPTTALSSDDDQTFIATPNSLMVANGELDKMRGGFSIGEGLDVSFGFQQTGSVNGVEQYSNSFNIDSMSSGFQDVDMSNMNSVILQNGAGNFVSDGVLNSLSDGFGNVIQNTLDNQTISTTTIYDISLQNIPGALQGLAGEQALTDTLGSF